MSKIRSNADSFSRVLASVTNASQPLAGYLTKQEFGNPFLELKTIVHVKGKLAKGMRWIQSDF